MRNEILHKMAEDLVMNAPGSPFKKAVAWINRVDNDYFDLISHDCEVLPDVLSPAFRQRVIDDFAPILASLATPEKALEMKERIISNEIFTPTAEEIAELADYCRQYGKSLLKIHPAPPVSDAEVDKLYSDAKTRTLAERIAKTNKNDVALLHQALMSNTVWHLRRMAYAQMHQLLDLLAEHLTTS